MNSCSWADLNERMKEYHDQEWGVPVHDDIRMFEHLSLENLQCGLSWDLMLKKRAVFRECFAGFDFEKIASFDENDVERILQKEGMLRSPQKIRAVISNAKCAIKLKEEYGTLCDYFWSFTRGKTIRYIGHEKGRIPVSNHLSLMISKDLKKRGFRYVGPVTIYSHMQACGMINDHTEECFCYAMINEKYPNIRKRRDEEVF